MTPPQRLSNWLAPLLVRIIWGVHYTNLGPFRAIRRGSLDVLAMQDRDFGYDRRRAEGGNEDFVFNRARGVCGF
jgi:hypothetical protein